MPRTAANNSLTLINKAGLPVILNRKRLEQLFAHTELFLHPNKNEQVTPENSVELSNQLLSRSGLKTAQQVIQFLKSPKGLLTIALINDELAEIAALEDDIQHQILKEQLEKKCFFALFLLGLMHKRKAHAHHVLDENAAQQREHKLHEDKQKAIAEEEAVAALQTLEPDQNDRDTYKAESTEIEKALLLKLLEAKILGEQLQDLQAQYRETIKKYAAYQDLIGAIHGQFNENTATETIQSKIEELTKEINQHQETLKSEDQTDMPHLIALRETIFGLNLQVTTLQDLKAVKNQAKVLYNKDYERVSSFADAEFILPTTLKFVKKDNKNYLIPSNQSLEDMSIADQTAAEEKFKQLKPEHKMSAKNLVQHYLGKEIERHHAKKEALFLASEVMQETLLLLQNQLLAIQATLTNDELLVKQPKPTPAMKMHPIPSTTPNSKWMSDNYKQILILMRENPTARSIAWLKSNLANVKPGDTLYEQLKALRPGAPIPPETMKNLLALNPLVSAFLQHHHPNSPAPKAADKTLEQSSRHSMRPINR